MIEVEETRLWHFEINHAFPFCWTETEFVSKKKHCIHLVGESVYFGFVALFYQLTKAFRNMSVLLEKNQLTLISIAETAKFYTSLCLGTTAFLSVFAFLFLIPFVVDPAISSLMADYEPEPVTCVATQHIYAEGISNCSWASCREGCTREATRCHQIYVNYSKLPFKDYRSSMEVHWDFADTRFLINTEGCGYPPSVNCSEFARQYGYATAGTPFPCYYSRIYPDIQVVARYSWDDTLRHLVLSITIPNLLFAASIGVLSYWYCPGCGRSCQKYMHHFPADNSLRLGVRSYGKKRLSSTELLKERKTSMKTPTSTENFSNI